MEKIIVTLWILFGIYATVTPNLYSVDIPNIASLNDLKNRPILLRFLAVPTYTNTDTGTKLELINNSGQTLTVNRINLTIFGR